MDKVQQHLEKALDYQRSEYRIDKCFDDFDEEYYFDLYLHRNHEIYLAVKELLEGDYLQVVFDSILKAIILKVEKEYERK